MRLRLFTLLLVPSVALFVMGYVVFADRQADVEQAALAADTTAVALQVADLDKALGAEALAATRFIEGEISWVALTTGAFADTDYQMAQITKQGMVGDNSDLAVALDEVTRTLGFRGRIEAISESPLQVVIRYSRARRVLLQALSVEIGNASTSDDSQGLLVLAALVEARSAHLNERIATELAIETGRWPSGQHSAAVAAIATHDSHVQFANNHRLDGVDEIEVAPELAVVRSTIRLSLAPPSIESQDWLAISDGWSSTLEQQIESNVAEITRDLLVAQQSASNLRRATVILISSTLLVAFLVALLVAMRIVKRVRVIASRAAQLAAGDTTEVSLASSLVGGSDEIAELAEAFDNMALEISIREDALAIESAVLEGIASGEHIEPTLRTLEWLLGSKAGRRDYRFTSEPRLSDAIAINDVADGYTRLYIEPVGDAEPLTEPYSPQARSAINLAALAQRRADDDAMLHTRATRDPLTGLFNRRAILEEGAELLSAAKEANSANPALIYSDLDGFKKINDTHGHAAGDRVLVESARRMQAVIADFGGTAGRVGGDEFILVVLNVGDRERLAEVAQSLVEALSAPIDLGAERVQIGVSIGAVLARNNTPMDDLISDADAALYAAKARGRGQTVISDPDFREQTNETAILTASVVDALAAEEFIPWFQPVWGDNGTQIAAFEALVRWKSTEGRTLSPARFMPILQQQNLVGALDALMFKKVCLILSEWMDQGRSLVPVHLNVSPSRIENLNFVDETKSMLEEFGIPPELIIIEVTESDLMTDITKNGRRLQELRDIGVLVAADDFGTGYSSLSYLRDLPVDILKIDRQFIDHIDKSPTNIKIVSAIIQLARSLGLSIVAEGVEREEELAVLNENGCHYIQGFLLGKPTPRKETEALLARYSGNLSSELAERLPTVVPDVDQRALSRHFDSLQEHLAEFGDHLGDAQLR